MTKRCKHTDHVVLTPWPQEWQWCPECGATRLIAPESITKKRPRISHWKSPKRARVKRPLKRCKGQLHLENLAGMLIVRENVVHGRCPDCLQPIELPRGRARRTCNRLVPL